MPRFRRLVVPGHPHHVTQRGVRRQATFFDEHDYRLYRRLATEILQRASLKILAYCLMPNHIHAVVVPEDRHSLAQFFGPLHKRYAQFTNHRYEWTGHLWQARFFSVVMDERHTLAAMRYVERNPVRSGLVEAPEDWPWSSVRRHLGMADDPLVDDTATDMLVSDWRNYVRAREDGGELDSLRRQTGTGRPGGEPDFIAAIERISGRKIRPQRAGRKKGNPNLDTE